MPGEPIAHHEAMQYAAALPGLEMAKNVEWHEDFDKAKADMLYDFRAGMYSSRIIERAIRISPWREYEKPE